MPLFVERAGADYLTGQELVEQLGAWLAGQYGAVETYLLEQIAKQVAKDLGTELLTTRLDVIRRLRQEAQRAFAQLADENLARRVVETAMREGEAAAIEQLGFTKAAVGGTTVPLGPDGTPLPFAGGITQGSALASAQIGLDLSNALDDLAARTIRQIPDVYQKTIAAVTSEKILAGTTLRQAQQKAATEFLSGGVFGFVDSAGRKWRIGSYAEMATRTATNRAWLEAHIQRWQGMGLNLVTIVRGADACQACASWAGKVLSTNGVTGTIEAEHAISGDKITVVIEGTVAGARAGGWNHPNCRCTLTPVFPGLSLPADDTTYDPQAEKNRDRMRYLERRVRDAKRREAVSAAMGDDVGAAAARRAARAEQEKLRDWSKQTGQLRKPYRESLSFSDGKALPPATPTMPRAVEPPKPPVIPPVDPLREALDRVNAQAAARSSDTRPLREALADQQGFKGMMVVARSRYPNLEWIGFDGPGIKPESLRAALSSLGDMLDKYPPGKTLKYVKAMPLGKDTLAQVRYFPTKGTQGLEIHSPHLRKTVADLEAFLKPSLEGGHFRMIDDAWGHVVTHEYGHVLDHALHAQQVAKVGAIAARYELQGIYGTAWHELARAAGNDSLIAEHKWLKGQLSGYGRKSGAEGVAELFADAELNGDQATLLARTFHERAVKIIREAQL